MARAAHFIRLMRPGDWVKNVFVLPALLFGERRGDWEAVGLTAVAFVSFALLSSGFYAINDVLDAERDRNHPSKATRPVAAGLISPGQATLMGLLLVAVALALGFATSVGLGACLVVYVLLQAAYNAALKRMVFVDVMAVALGFAARAAAGAYAIDVRLSIWLLLCVFFLCLYLGFVKRLCDLVSARSQGGVDWRPPAGYESGDELGWLLGLSGGLAVVTYLMYALSHHVLSLLGPRGIGFALLSPLVVMAIHRFYRRAALGRSDSPLAVMREDPGLAVAVLLFAAGALCVLYIPALDPVMRSLLTSDWMAGAAPGSE